jgi:hypothetical protein
LVQAFRYSNRHVFPRQGAPVEGTIFQDRNHFKNDFLRTPATVFD